MKTKMWHFNFTKKFPPRLPRHSGHLERLGSPFALEFFEQRFQSGAKGELSHRILVALGSKPNDGPVNVNVRQGETGLGKPASLVPGNGIGNPHPLRPTPRIQFLRYALVLDVGDPGLFRGRIRPDAKSLAGIYRGKPALDGLVHHNSEQLNLAKRRVFRNLVATAICVALAAPIWICSEMLARKLSGHKNTVPVQKRLNVPPHRLVSFQGAWAVFIPLPHKQRNPRIPNFLSDIPDSFLGSNLPAEFAGLPYVPCDSPHKLGGLLLASSGEGVSELHPDESRILSFVERGRSST
jgi:hypothetical protein